VIPDAVIDEIRDRVDVVAVIGRHMELKRSGRTWKGCCVFHGERTPSFHVYPEDKHFKCYGCGAFGDVFGFLQRLEGKEFPEVVRDLAREVGVEIPEAEEESAEQRRRRLERKELLAANDAAARYWSARLASRYGESARRYLEGRGVTEDSVRRFRLGVAADEWNDVARRLAEKGIGVPALTRAGLVIEKEKGGVYDRFRNRLMFPIAAMDGQIIGFGGRALGEEKGAKYINTPETPAYKKSKVLYGLDLAREHIRKTRQAVLVEGYFDVIGLHQAGVANAVAVCGTALTPEHVELLSRCDCREVTVLFDGDAAGLAAPAKAAEALFPAGMAGKVAVLPAEAGKIDPDEFARAHGKAGVDALLGRAIPLSSFLVDRAVDRACGPNPREAPLEHKLAAVRDLRPLVRLMPEGLARSVFEDGIAKKLDLDVAALREELASERARPAPGAARPSGQAAAHAPRQDPPQDPSQGDAPPPPSLQARAPWRRSAPPPAQRPRPQKLLLPGPAADALALLAVFPALRDAASELNLPEALPPGPLAELALALIRGELAAEEALARLEAVADDVTVGRARSQRAELAERELRKSLLKAKIERLSVRMEEIGRETARAGAAAPALAAEFTKIDRMKRDLVRQLQAVERPG
jgi:DNA primase